MKFLMSYQYNSPSGSGFGNAEVSFSDTPSGKLTVTQIRNAELAMRERRDWTGCVALNFTPVEEA